ncbi:helix-turn-helix domain-containing protein [Brevundimonas sp. RM1]
MQPRLLTEQEAADYLRVPAATLRRLSLGRVVLGTRHRYDRKALDHHLDQLSGLEIASPHPLEQADIELARFISDHPRPARPSQGQARKG